VVQLIAASELYCPCTVTVLMIDKNNTRHLGSYAAGGLAVAAVFLVATTMVSLIPADAWWIRVFDFSRLPSLVIIGVITLGCAVFVRRGRAVLLVMLVIAASLQIWRIYPYFQVVAPEIAQAPARSPIDSCFTVMGLNVFQNNRDYSATLSLIDRERPDILLLMETDSAWVSALSPVLKSYPHQLLRPLDNTYGLVFASQLPVTKSSTKNITDKDTPIVYARIETRDGQAFDFIGLHPRPPRPGQDTSSRDQKIRRAAEAIDSENLPVLAMGDFNDVPWSRTSQTFKKDGNFRDPRIGRGNFATFPSDFVMLGWPLDQLFLTPQFTFKSFSIGEAIGSDHRPLEAEICLVEEAK